MIPHLDWLLRFAQRRTESVGDADDAVRAACMKAWPSFADLRDPSKARPWLRRSQWHVVRVHDIGEAHGVTFLTMEVIEGASLQTVIASRASCSRVPSSRERDR